MGVLGVDDLRKSLEQGRAAPFYLLLGSSTWHQGQAVDAIRRATVPDADRALAESRGRVRDCDLNAVVDSARTLPLGVQRRLVIITEGQDLNRAEMELLASYAGTPQRTTTVVLCATKLGASTAARTLKQAVQVVECGEPRVWEMARWIRGELSRRELEYERGVVEALQALVGESPQEIAAGLEKLELYVQGRRSKVARVVDVEAVLSRVPHGTVWAFIEALEDRDGERTLRGLRSILEVGEPPESVMRLLLRSRRQLLAGLAAQHRGGDEEAVLEAMGTAPRARQAPRVRRAILSRLARHRLAEVVQSMPLLLEADSRIKGGGGGEPEIILTRLVMDLITPRHRPALAVAMRS